MRFAATLLLLGLLLAPAAAGAQPLGRLFFTPEQREALDARRRSHVPDKPTVAPVSPTTRVDGYVKRSHGKSTVWLDGYAVPDGVQPEGLRLRRGSDPTHVTVIVGENDRRVDVRVGQTLDRTTGEIKDPIGKGEIRIHRHGRAPR